MTLYDTAYVVKRLDQAGKALLASPGPAWKLLADHPDWVMMYDIFQASGAATYPPASREELNLMDEAYGWLSLIPRDRFVLRRVVGARSLVHPITDRHLFRWRRLARDAGGRSQGGAALASGRDQADCRRTER